MTTTDSESMGSPAGADRDTDCEMSEESGDEAVYNMIHVLPVKHEDTVYVRVSIDASAVTNLSPPQVWKTVASTTPILNDLTEEIASGNVSEDWEEESVYQLRKHRKSLLLPPPTEAQWKIKVCESVEEFERGLTDDTQQEVDCKFGIPSGKPWVAIELDPSCNDYSTGGVVDSVVCNIPAEMSEGLRVGAPAETLHDLIRKCYSMAMFTEDQQRGLTESSGNQELLLTLRKNMGEKIVKKLLTHNRDTLGSLQVDVYIDKSLSEHRQGFLRALGSWHRGPASED